MVIVRYGSTEIECDHAAKSDTDIVCYDDGNHIIYAISNILDEEWDYVSIEGGEWLNLADMPSEKEVLESDLNYMTMMNEFFEEENEELRMQIDIDRADLDFCLMLLGE